ncbi:hypothetical protein INR49_022652, partial [Caranx melampygus]
MMGVKTLLFVSLLAVLELRLLSAEVTSHHGRRLMPGSPLNISRNDHDLQQVIVKGVRYIVDLEISRTVCRKRDHEADLSKCDLQPPGPLHQ